jgi:hypothetical protein
MCPDYSSRLTWAQRAMGAAVTDQLLLGGRAMVEVVVFCRGVFCRVTFDHALPRLLIFRQLRCHEFLRRGSAAG